MSDTFEATADATALDPSEREGLLQSWITHRRDLDEAERDNIVRGAAAARRRLGIDRLLTEDFVRKLHARLFGDVWRWAGTYRSTERNLGVAPHRIVTEVATTLGDVRYWVEHQTHPPDEIAVRLHHRLVFVHPFPNGNGRHSRLMADLLIERLGRPTFTWGSGRLGDAGELRASYVAALRAADAHDIAPLVAFARS